MYPSPHKVPKKDAGIVSSGIHKVYLNEPCPFGSEKKYRKGEYESIGE